MTVRSRTPSPHGGPIRSAADLAQAELIAPERAAALAEVATRYAVSITGPLAAQIHQQGVDGPLARQLVPSEAELERTADERDDPIGDAAHTPVPGIVHRYPDRVLIKPTHACAVYCRFCFRRESVGPGSESLTEAQLDAALAYIAERSEIFEVILSGGDPLALSPRRIESIVRRLAAMAHVGVIRVHTRVPALAPERVTEELVRALRTDTAVFVVLHANHESELSQAARAACARIVDAGIPMLAQTVLLAGVNDDAATLEALFRALVRMRIKPYYLHHADRAPGTARFRTSLAAGRALVRDLRGRVSGLCQPTYVLDLPGGAGKVPVGPSYIRAEEAGGLLWIEDPSGRVHAYRDTGVS
jgi:lysine 2,3-aminomutase